MEKVKKEKMGTVKKMMLSLALGVAIGLFVVFLKEFLNSNNYEGVWTFICKIFFDDITSAAGNGSIGIFYILQQVFMNGLQACIVPLVFVSITLSICSMTDKKKLGRIAGKTIAGFMVFYVLGCIVASIIAMISKNAGLFNSTIDISEAATTVTEVAATNILCTIVNAVPSNVIATLGVNTSIVAVVFIAVILGISFNILEKELKLIKTLFEDLNKILLLVVNFLIDVVGPIAVFAMIVRTFAIYGISQIRPLLMYMGITILTLLFFLFIVYPLGVMVITKQSPIPFIKKSFKVGFWAFCVISSASTLPLNRRTCTEELGCSKGISDFALPLGMTINMNGTAIMHILAVTFIATSAGMEVTPYHLLTMSILAIASSAGTPAIPVAGSIMAYAVMTGAGFTSETCILIYSLVLAMNKPVEMFLTALNVVGDAAVTVIVSATEDEFDKDMYNTPVKELTKK